MYHVQRIRGFTLLEVLIAVLVFSFGLLGAAGLMVLSVRTNHSAYLRTQASFLAQGMADRIRVNLGSTSAYNGTYDKSSAGTDNCTNNICTPAQLVVRDKKIWSQQLVDFLPPGATASVDCGTPATSAAHKGVQPFSGLCNMTITWTEADLSRGSNVPGTQKFAWVFQP